MFKSDKFLKVRRKKIVSIKSDQKIENECKVTLPCLVELCGVSKPMATSTPLRLTDLGFTLDWGAVSPQLQFHQKHHHTPAKGLLTN